MLGKNLIEAAAGAAGAGEALGIEDVFSTWLYTGTGSTQTITNGIDLSGEGGLVWIKSRSSGDSHSLQDTARGSSSFLMSNATSAAGSDSNRITSFNSNGFTLGTTGFVNGNDTYASWTFRKAPGFFDVVTFTSTGTNSNRRISHSLGSAPGFVAVKRTDSSSPWFVYHRSMGRNSYGYLNTADAFGTFTNTWGTADPTSTDFGINENVVTINGATYVAYLFAHDEQIFGESGDQSVIKCGSYTGNGSATGPVVDLGWEPQWVMIKRATTDMAAWHMFDSMRGIATGGNDAVLYANGADAETSPANTLDLTATGFNIRNSSTVVNANGSTYIYIAIRRGPMKTPTDATKVFNTVAYPGNSSGDRYISDYGFPLDLLWYKRRNGVDLSSFSTRLTGGGAKQLATSAADAESNLSNIQFDRMLGFYTTSTFQNAINETGSTVASGGFRRAPGFFDVVAYAGSSSDQNISHNLGVEPELIIVKRRNSSWFWAAYNKTIGNNYYLSLNGTDAKAGPSGYWTNTTPTSTVFSVQGGNNVVNNSGGTYIAYLFATCPGVSKVFNYTGTGTTKQIDCGFTNGARFVLIKRTDSTGDWYVWDSARGIISGNDPYLLLNSTAAEVTNTDYIDPYSAGFEISSTAPAAINANGGSYIGLAIA